MAESAVITVLSFWAAFFTALSMSGVFVKKEDATASRLDRLTKPVLERGGQKVSVATHDHAQESPIVKDLRAKLVCAGLKRRSDLEKYILFQRICYSAPVFIAIISYFLFNVPVQTALLLGLLLGMIFIIVPRLWLLRMIFKRRNEIKRHLPDTLDLFVVALEAGLSFDSALVRIGEEQRRVSTHISREFLFTNQQILIGKPKEEALRGLAKRCGVPEMDGLVRAIIQSNKLGSSLVKTLRAQAESLRKKRKQDIHAQILKAPVKLIFPLLFFIFPTLLIVILGPSLIQIFRHLKIT